REVAPRFAPAHGALAIVDPHEHHRAIAHDSERGDDRRLDRRAQDARADGTDRDGLCGHAILCALAMIRRILLILAPWAAIVAIWYGIHYGGFVNPALVPTPHAVAARFWELAGGRLPKDVLMSTQRVFLGVALGILLAVPVGF